MPLLFGSFCETENISSICEVDPSAMSVTALHIKCDGAYSSENQLPSSTSCCSMIPDWVQQSCK